MDSSHVAALQAKHEGLERRIHEELNRPAPDPEPIRDYAMARYGYAAVGRRLRDFYGKVLDNRDPSS